MRRAFPALLDIHVTMLEPRATWSLNGKKISLLFVVETERKSMAWGLRNMFGVVDPAVFDVHGVPSAGGLGFGWLIHL